MMAGLVPVLVPVSAGSGQQSSQSLSPKNRTKHQARKIAHALQHIPAYGIAFYIVIEKVIGGKEPWTWLSERFSWRLVSFALSSMTSETS